MLVNWGLLLLRLVLGLTFISHGGQKLFGWFGGGGIKGTTGMMERIRIRPASFWAVMAALAEFGGGLLVFLGFLNPVGSLGIIAAMLMAIIHVHWPKGFWNTKGGIEFPLMNLTAALALAITGPGAFSLDSILHIALPEPLSLIIGLVLVILGVLAARLSQTPQVVQNTGTEQRR